MCFVRLHLVFTGGVYRGQLRALSYDVLLAEGELPDCPKSIVRPGISIMILPFHCT